MDGFRVWLVSPSPCVIAFTLWHKGPLSTVISLMSSIFCSKSLNSGQSSKAWPAGPCHSQLLGSSSSTIFSTIPCLHISWKITFMGVFISGTSHMYDSPWAPSTALIP
ncbi:hypothetical protein Lalb_Chr10g0094011 [Lupinus albus]|uniref:Uncharacterized protein n=1 Tax=Lupinus albus TaxID=3870 RepID=A0A6A4PTX1_LUPAL|nr:hypothetical protein Lalb_Chr10g0094011 [Lupinus albus]